MKLSSILLLGANLIAVPCATAADNDCGNWLKANLAQIKQEAQVQSTTPVAAKPKTTLPSKRTAQRATTAANGKGIMLRAFQPGRALPRQKDLVMQYAQVDNSLSPGFAPAQQASMDQSQLNGRVCAFQQPTYEMQQPSPYQSWANIAAKAAKNEAIARPVKAAVRNVIQKAPAISQQLGVPMQMPSQMQMPMHNQMVASLPPTAAPSLPQMQMRAPAPQQMQQAPIFSAEDEAELNRILAASSPSAGKSTGDMSQQTGNPAPGAGQAPFPLNLLFGNTAPSQKPSNPLIGKPKFGQWHPKHQLAYGGFGGSNITHGKRRKHHVQRSVAAQVPTRRQTTTVAKKRTPAPTVAKTPVPMPATVAQYPPYTGYSRPF